MINEKGGTAQTSEGTLGGILADVTQIFTAIIGWVSSVVQTVVSNPLLLIFVIMGLAFVGVTMVRKLMNL